MYVVSVQRLWKKPSLVIYGFEDKNYETEITLLY